MHTQLSLPGSPKAAPFAAQERENLSSEPSPADEAYNARLSRIAQDPLQQMAQIPPQLPARKRRLALPDSPEAFHLPPSILSNIPGQDVNSPRPPEAIPPHRVPVQSKPLQLLAPTAENPAERSVCTPHAPEGKPPGGRNKTRTRVTLQLRQPSPGPGVENDTYQLQPRRHVRYRSSSEPLPRLLPLAADDGGEPDGHIPHPPQESRHEGSPIQNRSPRLAAMRGESPREIRTPHNMLPAGFDFHRCESKEDFLAQLKEDPHAKLTFMKACARERSTENSGFIIDWLEKAPEQANNFAFLKRMYLKYISETSSEERREEDPYLNLNNALTKTLAVAYREADAADKLRKFEPSADHEEAGNAADQTLSNVIEKAFLVIADRQYRNFKTRAPYQGE